MDLFTVRLQVVGDIQGTSHKADWKFHVSLSLKVIKNVSEKFMSSNNEIVKVLESAKAANDDLKDVTTGEVKSPKRISKSHNEVATAEVLESAKAACSVLEEVENVQDKKRVKLATDSKEVGLEASTDTEWVHIFNMTLKVSDRDQLLMGKS